MAAAILITSNNGGIDVETPLTGAGLTSVPTRSAGAKRTAIEVAQDLVESLAAEYEHENFEEREHEIVDRVAVAWGRAKLVERLGRAKGSQLSIQAAHGQAGSGGCAVTGTMAVTGNLVDLGPDWLIVAGDPGPAERTAGVASQTLLPLDRILAVEGLPAALGAPPRGGKIWERRRLTQLLRPLTDARTAVRVHSDVGCFPAQVLRVGEDHLDLELRGSTSGAPRVLSLRFAALTAIEADFYSR